MAIKKDFEKGEVEAARSVMFDLMRLLKPYLKHIVIIGGSVPRVMFPTAAEAHVGTIDVDLAIDHEMIQSPDFGMITTTLIQNNYRQNDEKPFLFYKEFEMNGKHYKIQVDLLTEGRSTDRNGFAQAVHGCELAFEEPKETQANGIFPDGKQGVVTLRVASIVSLISMKVISFVDRLNPKDAYDIYYCVRYYQSGLQMLAHEFKRHLGNPLVQEGVEKLRENFSSIDSRGPKAVAEFLGEYHDDEKHARTLRDAYERINGLVQQILN
jgi:Nucleotidyl transferase AbiEii toxin, Type IV TA system